MKRFFIHFSLFLLFLCNSAFLGAFELEIGVGINGLTYDPDKISAYSEPDTEKEFTNYSYFLANVNFRQNISEILNFSLNFERDNVLQNSLSAVFGAKTDFINVNFGVFMGFPDKFTQSDTGITGNLEFLAFKTILLSVSGLSTLGAQYDFTSNNSRETAKIKLGFYIGSLVPSFSAEMKSFSREVETGIFKDDTLYRFLLNMDFLLKDFIISGYVNAGYQVYSRVYKKDAEYTDKLNSYLAGFGFYWHGKPLGFKLGLEVPFLLSAKSPMTVSNEYLSFTKAYAGLVLTIE